ncbi:X-linked interleukin-1 receptor accessory protein-like 2 [Zophobas morio]|uniref:X-linked interleukin-1 receptor accessory protein-like 2 n=1 Tax=Zophobas morio TaxID=2755281 RepID=UPI0030833831
MAVLKIGVFTVCLLYFGPVFAIEDYCSSNTYSTNETHMQFTKEPSSEEFAIAGKFKGLHCCAKGYRSIEWYKDGKPYPWPLMVSQLILYPESANQTVYTQSVTEADAGNYTCVLKNDSIAHSHTIQLKVFEKIPDDPKITYVSQDSRVRLGQNLRLFCEAFAGRVDLPDAHNEVVWRKSGHNGTLDDEPRVRQEKISREDGQTFGTYLIIDNLRREDYGEYICKITKPGKSIEQRVYVAEKSEVKYLNPNPVPVTKLILCMSAIFFLCLAAVILNLQYGLPLRVRFKDSFGIVEENDGKANDVLILYSSKDSEIALGVLMPTLQTKFNYKCVSREFPLNLNYWFGELQDEALKSRRIIALLSPPVLNDTWTTAGIYQAIKQLQALGPKLICVTLKELPKCENETKNSQGETLSSLTRTINVIVWERAKDDKFWLALRLRLPPKRRNDRLVECRNQSQGINDSRLTSDSDESFENFV